MTCIDLKSISKNFQIGAQYEEGSRKAFFYRLSGREPKKTLHALENITLEIQKGEFVGIIGPNGSGKSTLLSLIGHVYKSDGGTLSTTGKIIPIIGLINGLQDRLTMKDNIYLCCALFGLNRTEITRRFDAIVEFSKLKEFTYSKLHHFSIGMKARLVFSMAIHCDPDILLIDEITGNLDSEFVQLVLQTIQKGKETGLTTLIVSHQKFVIEHCSRVIWLEKGRIKKFGAKTEVVPEYFTE